MLNQPVPFATARFQALAFRIVPLLAFAGGALACLALGSAWSAAAGPWPWLVSLVFVGLPHGAADLAVTRRVGGDTRAILPLSVSYLVLMAVASGAFAVAPVPVLVAFVALSGWHFGAAHADTQSPPPPRRAGMLTLSALARGAPVLGIPLVMQPEASAGVAATVAALAGGDPGFDPAVVRAIGMVLVALGATSLVAEVLCTRGEPGAPARVRATLVDLVIIGLFEAVADPLFAVGCYFLGWHAWRQMPLLATALGCRPVDGPRALGAALLRIHAAALPLLVPTWAMIAAAWCWLPAANLPRDARGLAALSLAVYVVVTPSHDLLMDWWRWRRGRLAASISLSRAWRPGR